MINMLKIATRQHVIVSVILLLCFGSSQAEIPDVPLEVPLLPAPVRRTLPVKLKPVPLVASDAELSVDRIYNKAIRSVVWIVTKTGQASGVLIDTELRLVVTNHHVVADTEEHGSILVIFPVRDWKGKLIKEQTFYRDESNLEVLLQLGYATIASVVAKDAKTDLAIIELEGLPETARAIDYYVNKVIMIEDGEVVEGFGSAVMDRGAKVHVIGNPEGKLWRWTAGFFVGRDQGMLRINAATYGGNSGGPVLNARGELIGIATLSNRRTETWAVPEKYVDDLLATLEPRHISSISNNLEATITFHVKGAENGEWKEEVIKSGDVAILCLTGAEKIPDGYLQVRFDEIANDGKVTFCDPYFLKTNKRYFGSGVENSPQASAYKYYFDYNPLTETVSLRELEEHNR